jgi:hypothetical protein
MVCKVSTQVVNGINYKFDIGKDLRWHRSRSLSKTQGSSGFLTPVFITLTFLSPRRCGRLVRWRHLFGQSVRKLFRGLPGVTSSSKLLQQVAPHPSRPRCFGSLGPLVLHHSHSHHTPSEKL